MGKKMPQIKGRHWVIIIGVSIILIAVIGLIGINLLKTPTFLPEWQDCNSDDDCMLAGTAGPCSCGPTSINKANIEEYNAYINKERTRQSVLYKLGYPQPLCSICIHLTYEAKCENNKCYAEDMCGKEGEQLYQWENRSAPVLARCCEGLKETRTDEGLTFCEKSNQICAKKGEFVNPVPGYSPDFPDSCCHGLKPMAGLDPNTCEQLIGTPFLTCMPCGDGACENTKTENRCNCPEDCR